jgi:hypothetical protein
MSDIAKLADLKELVGSFVDFEDEDHEAGELWLTREVMTYRHSASKSG